MNLSPPASQAAGITGLALFVFYEVAWSLRVGHLTLRSHSSSMNSVGGSYHIIAGSVYPGKQEEWVE